MHVVNKTVSGICKDQISTWILVSFFFSACVFSWKIYLRIQLCIWQCWALWNNSLGRPFTWTNGDSLFCIWRTRLNCLGSENQSFCKDNWIYVDPSNMSHLRWTIFLNLELVVFKQLEGWSKLECNHCLYMVATIMYTWYLCVCVCVCELQWIQ